MFERSELFEALAELKDSEVLARWEDEVRVGARRTGVRNYTLALGGLVRVRGGH
jgi:hypothetical protein